MERSSDDPGGPAEKKQKKATKEKKATEEDYELFGKFLSTFRRVHSHFKEHGKKGGGLLLSATDTGGAAVFICQNT